MAMILILNMTGKLFLNCYFYCVAKCYNCRRFICGWQKLQRSSNDRNFKDVWMTKTSKKLEWQKLQRSWDDRNFKEVWMTKTSKKFGWQKLLRSLDDKNFKEVRMTETSKKCGWQTSKMFGWQKLQRSSDDRNSKEVRMTETSKKFTRHQFRKIPCDPFYLLIVGVKRYYNTWFYSFTHTHIHTHRHTQTHTHSDTLGRTPVGEGSARHRDLYLTTDNTHKQTYIYASDGIQTRNPSKRATTRPQGSPYQILRNVNWVSHLR
jgi:hypothetical protein